jgi:hypothetical protein
LDACESLRIAVFLDLFRKFDRQLEPFWHFPGKKADFGSARKLENGLLALKWCQLLSWTAYFWGLAMSPSQKIFGRIKLFS